MPRDSNSGADTLQPVDPFALLERLRLTTGKAAEFCGVSRRQLCYWTDIGLVTATEDEAMEQDDSEDAASRRSYDFPSLYKIMLIKQVLARVKGLRRAAKEINDFLQQRSRETEELRASIDKKREAFLSSQADKLDGISRQIRERYTQLRSREKLLSLSEGMTPLLQMTQSIASGATVLEEDPATCVRLASLIEQLEARLEGLATV
jgi:DNA-binding transcriptional MerR regulator